MLHGPESWRRVPWLGRARLALTWLLVLAFSTTGWASDPPSASQQPSESASQFGSIVPYLGLTIDQLEMPGVPPEEAAMLLAATSLKIGEPLTRENLHDSLKSLFATGRFSDIQAEADRTETTGVDYAS